MMALSGSPLGDPETKPACGIVYAAEFNGNASFLAAGDSAGKLALFDIPKSAAVNSAVAVSSNPAYSSSRRPASPCLTFRTDAGSIYAMHSEGDLLACGVDSGMLFTTWREICDGKSRFQALQIKSPYLKNVQSDQAFEVNAIAAMSGGDRLFAAAGDGNAYSFSLDTLQQTQTFLGSGPCAYLHCIAMHGTCQQHVFLTGAEDGCVRIYDDRTGPKPLNILTPCKTDNSISSSWIGSVITDDDGVFAMVGTGSGKLSSLHISSSAVAHSAQLDVVPVSMKMMGDNVYCGGVDKRNGDASSLHLFNMQCEPVSGVHSSKAGIYSIAMHSKAQVAATAGYSLTPCGLYALPDVLDVYLSPPLHSFSMVMA